MGSSLWTEKRKVSRATYVRFLQETEWYISQPNPMPTTASGKGILVANIPLDQEGSPLGGRRCGRVDWKLWEALWDRRAGRRVSLSQSFNKQGAKEVSQALCWPELNSNFYHSQLGASFLPICLVQRRDETKRLPFSGGESLLLLD